MGADSFGREPHTVREWVESLGADDRGADRIRVGPEVRAQMGGGGRWARTVRRILETTATFCDHLYQICKL
jgi:hypothetical protein